LARLAHVDLTTVRQEARVLARTALTRLVERLDSGGTASNAVDVVVPPLLVVRGSTAPTIENTTIKPPR
jgi:DNA-binding LacI/PurR family transcriptional regulator